MAHRLGNTRYFILSLGKENGPCSGMCRGVESVTFSTWAGPVEVGVPGRRTEIAAGDGGYGGYLHTPTLPDH